jgi:beta-glucosidase
VSALPGIEAAGAEVRFPEGFVWGAATSAYQIEGAVDEDGRGRSIWDTFSHTPGRTAGGENGDVAVDHYHRFREDVALMAQLGLRAYRFSISWPRVQPGGRGPVNERGLDFYRRLVDELLAAGIEPYPTLFHWDLPQELEDEGGWAARATAERFAAYAEIVAGALGDRVTSWLTLNEPWCAAFLGYGMGRHAPGLHDARKCVAAAHHLMLAHGHAVDAIRRLGGHDARAAVVLNLDPVRPATSSAEDAAAARLVDGMHNRIFLEPILAGRYPDDVLAHLSGRVDLGHVRDGDERVIAAPLDFLGVNYYRPARVAARARPAADWTAWPGDERIEHVAQEGPKTTMDWPVDPTGLREMLGRLHAEYAIPMLVTENGASFDDDVGPDGAVHDERRVAYLDGHLRAVAGAIEAGADVRGYFVWSLLDNFEWAEGYSKRFGIVHVDYQTLARTPKDSARWYRDAIARNGLR